MNTQKPQDNLDLDPKQAAEQSMTSLYYDILVGRLITGSSIASELPASDMAYQK